MYMVMFDDDIKQTYLSEPPIPLESNLLLPNPSDKILKPIPQEGFRKPWSAQLVAVLFPFDIQLTSLSPRNCIPQECFPSIKASGMISVWKMLFCLVQSQNL
ncbi:hypothetical protein Tco_0584402 [Tanacetum coccineum]|uniref:Uncharacterized protein n=1 Tax=Tanacetum coccineum TaxID=301880 RepID=A0ABQ5DZJ1_9ASTR